MPATAWATGTATAISGNGGAGGSINNLAVQGSGYYYWGGSPSFLTLRINNFGFSDLPDGSTIDSFEVRHWARDTGSTNVYTDQVFGQKIAGTNLATNVGGTTAGFRINYTAQWRTISAGLFGTTWTTTEAKGAGFGVYFRFGNYDAKFSPNLELDAIQVRVNYTAAAASSSVERGMIATQDGRPLSAQAGGVLLIQGTSAQLGVTGTYDAETEDEEQER